MKLTHWYMNAAYQSAHDSDTIDQDVFKAALEVVAKAYGLNHTVSVEYLIQYGWKQSLGDCYAGERAKARKEAKLEKEAVDTQAVSDVVIALIGKRIKSILAGELQPDDGNSRDAVRTIARQLLESYLASKGGSLPKDKEQQKKMIDLYIEMNRPTLDAEIEKRRKIKKTEVNADDFVKMLQADEAKKTPKKTAA